MNRTTIRLTVGIALVLFGARAVDARGFGGYHAGGAAGGGYHESSYHESGSSAGYHENGGYHESAYHESGAYARGPESAGEVHHGANEEVYHGSDGATVVHGSADVHGAAAGPYGAAAGGKEVSGTAVKGPDGNEYTHESSAGRGVAAGPEGVEAGRYGATSSTYHGADGGYYSHGAAGSATAHTALPTDAGYGAAARTSTTAYAGYHHTEAVSGSVYAARGAAVRNSYIAPGLYGQSWHAANPGAWAATGWTANQAWNTPTWPAIGASLGWGSIQPASYDYGSSITYQDNEVYYGDQPAATAGQYYQQAETLATTAPPPAAQTDEWFPLGVFALVRNDQSDPNYVMQLAVNKAGTLAGNYSDLVSGTSLPIHGAVDKRTQRVAWTIGSNKNTVGEAGLYNLTKDEAPALIHIGKDKTEQWLLVRMKQPDQASNGQ